MTRANGTALRAPAAPCPAVEFRVYGTAVAKGSTRAFARPGRRAVVTADNPSLAKWESAVRFAAETVVTRAGHRLFDGGVMVAIAVFVPRPRSVRRPLPTTRPDLDKVARGMIDPLIGILFYDDAQVVELHAAKRYTTGPAYADVIVTPVGRDEVFTPVAHPAAPREAR